MAENEKVSVTLPKWRVFWCLSLSRIDHTKITGLLSVLLLWADAFPHRDW